jgi:hypothetical protein
VKSKCFVTLLFLLTVLGRTVQAQSYTIAVSPNPANVAPGAAVVMPVTITADHAFNSSIVLSVSGLSAGLTPTFIPSSTANPPYAGLKLIITADSSIAPITAPLSITIIGTVAGTPTPSAAIALTAQSSTNQTSQSLLGNLGFGLALGLSTNVTGPNIVNNATVDANGIVRVNTRANTSAGFMFETHYYIWTGKKYPIATGPFVAAQPGSSQIISAVGAGWMLGFRRPQGSSTPGFGLGLGYEAQLRCSEANLSMGRKPRLLRMERQFQSDMRRKTREPY